MRVHSMKLMSTRLPDLAEIALFELMLPLSLVVGERCCALSPTLARHAQVQFDSGVGEGCRK
jgi:hypothetical protein